MHILGCCDFENEGTKKKEDQEGIKNKWRGFRGNLVWVEKELSGLFCGRL